MAGSSTTVTPGAAASSRRASSGESGSVVSIQTASEWPRHTGTRTQVAEIGRSGLTQDLAGLAHQLGLFLGVPVVVEHVAVWEAH